MTWDVCSEAESQIQIIKLSVEVIDKIVSNMYLTTFDRPPIDNIRDLVRKDKDIRNAIVEIEYHQGKAVSDKVKSKLYLSGIINYNENDIQIKNRIIRECLSLEWIKSVEEEGKGMVAIAMDLYDKQKYNESLIAFEQYLIDSDFEEAEESVCYYYMGYASYRNSDFNKAIEYLEKTKFEVDEDPRLFYRVLNLKGLVYYYDKQINKSLDCLKQVMNSGRKDEIYMRSLMNYGAISLDSDIPEHKNEAIKIFEDIINETGFQKREN